MIYIALISVILFRIMVYPSLKILLMIRKIEKSAKEISQLFEKLEKEIEKKS